MKKHYVFLIVIAFFFLLLSFSSNKVDNATYNNGPISSSMMQDTVFDEAQALVKIEELIKGKEDLPAEEVFENIKILKGMPAGRVTRIMKFAFNNSLGVNCTHCHTPGKWASEEKPTKQISRDMWAMVATINQDLLTQIENLDSERPVVNCTTCHRGAIKPELRMK